MIATQLWAQDGKVSIQYATVPKAEIELRLRMGEVPEAEREPKLRELFEKSGCESENLTEQPVKRAKAPNVICTLPGETASTIVVGSHFDFVSAGKGLVDNWSGSSLLPSIYLSLKGASRRHTYLFVGFTDEEKGLVGSRFYVDKLTKEQIRQTSAMINLDTLGLSPTKIEINPGDKKLAGFMAQVATSLHLPLGFVNVHRVGKTDSDSFLDRHMPTLNVHSLTSANLQILHTGRDSREAIHIDDYYDTYLLVRAYLAYLDQALDPPTAPASGPR